jgi:pimeloyl-ACP methyl ester carboxylesterase
MATLRSDSTRSNEGAGVVVTAGMVPTHRVVEMRRALRHTAVVTLLAAVATACAATSSEERALLDNAADSIDGGDLGTSNGTGSDGDLSDEDFDADEPWLAEDVADEAGQDRPRPEIQQFRCPFDRESTTAARCGKVELPGRGEDPDYTVELSFVRFSATGEEDEKQPDPLVYLHGGPGGAILESADVWYDSIVSPHIATRDVILYDQRGAGRSTPLPQCRETATSSDRFYTDDASHESLTPDYLSAIDECAQRLLDQSDIDLTAFNSAANAQDLVDLMWVLGIEEYNIHGSSYGTRLAQTIMRDAPEGVRSLILSGVYPIEVNLMGSIPGSFESALDAVFDGCAAAARCRNALPDPWSTLEDLVVSLDADPMTVEVSTTALATFTLSFDGTDLLNGLHSLLYVGVHAATIPDLLIDWIDGDDRRIERLARVSVFDHSDIVVFLLVQCSDEASFTTDELLRRPLQHEFLRATDLAPSLNGLDALAICDDWELQAAAPVENEPVTWDAPTLLLSGAIDPITPPGWAAALAARLPRSRLVNMADLSHDSDEGWCSTGLMADFVEQPDVLLDTSCAAFATHLTVDELAERFREPFSLIEQSYDFDGDGEYVGFNGPDWGPEWTGDAQVQWRALDQLDPTALILLDVDSAYDPVGHLAFGGRIPDWTQRSSPATPPGWEREEMVTTAGSLIRYTHETSGVGLVLVLEPDEPDDLEGTVLIPTARSIGGGS